MANLSPKGRVSFPDVYEARAFNPGDKGKFALTLLFDPNNMDEDQKALLVKLKEAANAAAQERFKCNVGETYKGKPIASPFHKSEEKPEYYDPGLIYVKFSSQQKPGVVYGNREPIPEDSGDFYAGCWAHVSYDAYAYDHSGNRGVAFGLRNVQKTGDGDSFSGSRTRPEDDFGVVEESVDEIPF